MQSSSDLGQLTPRGGGDPIPLPKSSLLIGRREGCDIILEYPNVSSHHCQLEMQNGYWHIKDMRSRNGIKVNGERVDSKFLLPGDTITIAKHHFTIDYQPTGDAPPPVDDSPFAMSLLEKAGLEAKREARRRSGPLPPPAKKLNTAQPPGKFSADEDAAAAWLMDDE
jgi:pSer/pThr/pTyr-binding forkhead associated (FHA) protein